jgi:hypothetical protein
MQNLKILRQSLLGELAMSPEERGGGGEKMPFIGATNVFASSQGQRTLSAQTKIGKIKTLTVTHLPAKLGKSASGQQLVRHVDSVAVGDTEYGEIRLSTFAYIYYNKIRYITIISFIVRRSV